MVLDFEKAFSNVFTNMFPTTTIVHDYFHFVQANIKKVGVLGLKAKTKRVEGDLCLHWYLLTKATFDTRLHELLDKWCCNILQYASYVESTWLEHFPPEQ